MEPLNMLYQKIAKATASMHGIVKDQTADVKTYTYSYASLNSVLRVVKAGLDPFNLVLSQPIGIIDGNLVVTTMIMDIDTGDCITFPGAGTPIKGDPQAAGSTISYFRRYALVSLFALEAEDDDGALAHRASVNPENRTAAETEVRRMIAAMEPAPRQSFMADFKETFGCGLSDLPESRHGEALGYTKFWVDPANNTPPATETATETATTAEAAP